MTEIRAAGVVSRGVAAVIDLIIVATVLAAIYLGLILTRLMFHPPTAFRAPTMGASSPPPCCSVSRSAT